MLSRYLGPCKNYTGRKGRTLDADGDPATTGDIQQTKYMLDDGQVVLQFEKTGTGNLDAGDLSNRYLWGPAVDQLLADEQIDWSDGDADGEVLWALTDHLGSVRDLVDNAGAVQNHKSYDAFGNVAAETNAAIDTVFGYTGKLFDDATGLQNNLNRWYDPAVGRWLSEDPINFAAADPNLYGYVGNQPTRYVDYTGLEASDPMIKPHPCVGGPSCTGDWPPEPPGGKRDGFELPPGMGGIIGGIAEELFPPYGTGCAIAGVCEDPLDPISYLPFLPGVPGGGAKVLKKCIRKTDVPDLPPRPVWEDPLDDPEHIWYDDPDDAGWSHDPDKPWKPNLQ